MREFETRERADQDAAAAAYETLYHGFGVSDYWDADFVDFLAPYWATGDRVLDLGCGPGSLHEHWHRLPRPSRLVGVDISPKMIDEARKRFHEDEFVVARVHELPFESGSFDLVIASSVLHHIPDEHLGEAIDEIVRVLDEHGRVIGRDPVSGGWGQDPGWLSGALMTFRHLAFRLTRSREFPEPALGNHHHVLQEGVLRGALERGLTVTRFETRFPFSPLFLRIRDQRLAELAKLFDRKLADRRGQMAYFVAERNYATQDDLESTVERAIDEAGGMSDAEFLALLQAAGEELTRLFASDLNGPAPTRRPREDRPDS